MSAIDESRAFYFKGYWSRLEAVAAKHGVDRNNIHQHKAAFREFRRINKPFEQVQRAAERELAHQ